MFIHINKKINIKMNNNCDDLNSRYKTIRFLCNYRTHLMRKIQLIKNKYCNLCSDEINLDTLCGELSLLDNHIYNTCKHNWYKDYIEINEEMQLIILCNICECKKGLTH